MQSNVTGKEQEFQFLPLSWTLSCRFYWSLCSSQTSWVRLFGWVARIKYTEDFLIPVWSALMQCSKVAQPAQNSLSGENWMQIQKEFTQLSFCSRFKSSTLLCCIIMFFKHICKLKQQTLVLPDMSLWFCSASECCERDERLWRADDHHEGEMEGGAGSHGVPADVPCHQCHSAHCWTGGKTLTFNTEV